MEEGLAGKEAAEVEGLGPTGLVEVSHEVVVAAGGISDEKIHGWSRKGRGGREEYIGQSTYLFTNDMY